ncbi:DUF4031 domain-containing protein [Leucobacter sp. USCH14]|uniref:DUF4031 domain-containing protein n=1 Tax=Leucobacter sp. USCH14 TaxID=3024838 RepID=UPI003094E57A
MVILIDPPAWPAHGTLWSHLVSDTSTDELHAFARLLGFPRRSFDLDHYDISAANYDRAVALGAIPVAGRELVHRLRDAGLRVRQVDRDAITPLRRRQYLVEQWAELGVQVGVDDAVPARAWERVGEEALARWNEPHRSYHDERHLEDVLLALDHLETRGERISPVTLLAAWFHDAVYTGSAGDDERASAELAVSALTGLGLDVALVEEVGASIIATTPGGADTQSESNPHPTGVNATRPVPALAHLLDADLWIFASHPSRYAEYASAVRSEYAHVSDADFSMGRARILESYLNRPTLYFTGAARHLWESRARANVAGEIARLRGAHSEAPR